MSEEDQIIADIGQKLADDISAAIYRNLQLVDDRRLAFIVATFGAASAIGAASAAMMEFISEPTSPEEAADGLWSTLRPMVVQAMEARP